MGTTLTRFTLVFLLAVPSSLFAEDRRPDTSRLSVMTINTLFMWDGVAPEEGSSTIQFPWKGDAVAASAHMAEIAQLIKATNPDIINLVEVENLASLALLNNSFLAGYPDAADFRSDFADASQRRGKRSPERSGLAKKQRGR
jgi:hypothetical protein